MREPYVLYSDSHDQGPQNHAQKMAQQISIFPKERVILYEDAAVSLLQALFSPQSIIVLKYLSGGERDNATYLLSITLNS